MQKKKPQKTDASKKGKKSEPQKPAAQSSKAGAADKPKAKQKQQLSKKPTVKKAKDVEDDLLDDGEFIGTEDIPELEELDDDNDVEVPDVPLVVEEVPASTVDEVYLTDAEGRRYCRVKECDQAATVDAYCRFHYLLYWKKIQIRKKILTDGKLERYVEELTSRYPDKFLEIIRKDLRSEKDFLSAIAEMEIDESANLVDNEYEDEAQTYIEEVRGLSESAAEDEEF